MKNRQFILTAVLALLAILVTACGTAGTPPYEATAAAADAQANADAIIAEARETATAIVAAASEGETAEDITLANGQATARAVIATANARVEEAEVVEDATEEPEVVEDATEEPEVVEDATEEPEVVEDATEEAEVAEDTSEVSAEESLLMTLVDLADAETGEEIFAQMYTDVGFACSTCHLVDSENMLVGPGMLNIFDRAGDRVEGQGAYTYLYESIRNSQAYIVEGYPAGVMPNYTEEILPDEDIYHIMAYLRTLEE